MERVMRMMIAAAAFSLVSIQSQAQSTNPPANTPNDIGERVYVADTGTYEAVSFLGGIGIIDGGRVTMFVDKPHFLCPYDKAISSVKLTQMPGAQALEITASKGYSGSLGFFVVSANISDDQKMSLTVDDLSTAQLSVPCGLGESDIRRIATSIPMARGKRVIYVNATTLSHLTKEVFDKQSADASASAGNWLRIGGDGYKSNGHVDSVPITAVRGIYVDVPPVALPPNAVASLKLSTFSSLSELGQSGRALEVAKPVKLSIPVLSQSSNR